ncbi:helix-turn-helix domain-containing protein [Agromyces aerolatus]|uniref:helix-turn-helix domain-containing protein n=1 Tax=Agromyces sp. LY-1074 TaxID=3074080 RepID=UPI00285DFAB2|nr:MULTISPECIES: cupin domain-containing protein [unclassified Agromyces]MDR5698343.1 cupin domain-containing protein [Agromyces sp. LY-1074]MDR5704637.1 cupin domain-containing protein [Agromyces sp. LY-1358]
MSSTDAGQGAEVVGPRVRQLREAKGMSMRALAQRSGLSGGFLSQVERGLSSIALSSLHKVADALDVTMADLFAGAEAASGSGAPTATPVGAQGSVDDDGVVFTLNRAADRPSRIVSSGRHYEMLSARVPGLTLEPMLVYIEPGGRKEEPSAHKGEEFAYVLEGELLYEVDGVEYRLTAGDSLFLRSNTPHVFHNDGDVTTVVVSVVTPRHY